MSFEPRAVAVAAEAGAVADKGELCGSRNGRKYGWNCVVPDAKMRTKRTRTGKGRDRVITYRNAITVRP